VSVVDRDVQVVELLLEHEASLSKLYDLYSSLFKNHRHFWHDLSRAEQRHANWLRELEPTLSDGEAFARCDRFRAQAIRCSVDYVQHEIDRAQTQPLKLINALSVASWIERALLEKKFFEVFDTDSPRLKAVLQRLSEETAEHAKTVHLAWEKETLRT
jgi:hypothetical protein